MHLTILTTPSRHGLGGGNVWQWFKEHVIPANVTYDIHDVLKVPSKWGDRVLLMGQQAVNIYLNPEIPLSKAAGTVYTVAGLPAVPTYDLQDAYDFKIQDTDKEDTFGKDRAKTQKTNWLFWIKADTQKLLRNIQPATSPNVLTQPNLGEYTKHLLRTANTTVYLDIETDISSDTLDCIGLYIEGDRNVVVVPVYRWNTKLAYSTEGLVRYFSALSYVLKHNKVVIHNSMFDLLYLSSHYRILFGPDIYDTMLAHKRALPEVEKSLGHAIRYWTYQPYHKDEHAVNASIENEQRLWQYNAKDIWSMRCVYLAQQRAMAEDPALASSINQANASIYPYLLASLRGMYVDLGKLAAMKLLHDRRGKQILRVIRTLSGEPNLNPNSSKQLIAYFHTKLGYEAQGRTETGQPKLDTKAMYGLALKYQNPLLQAIIKYREVTKARSMMDFNNLIFPWQSI